MIVFNYFCFFEANGHFLMAASRNTLDESVYLIIDLVDFVKLLATVKVVPIFTVLDIDETLSLSLLGLHLLC